MGATKIPWCDRTWSPITGCTKISDGCKNCWAHAMHARFGEGPFKVTFHADRLDEPLRWRKPSRIFVCSMGDLFHEDVTTDDIETVFAVMALATRHVFILLTKRPERMLRFICGEAGTLNIYKKMQFPDWLPRGKAFPRRLDKWPPKNLWLGVSVENQATADERIPILLQTPAAVRFVSCEPLLGPVSFRDVPGFNKCGSAGVDLLRNFWCIVGCESGPSARPCEPSWVRSIIGQCKTAGIPLFVKQWRDPMNGKLVKMPRIDGKVFD